MVTMRPFPHNKLLGLRMLSLEHPQQEDGLTLDEVQSLNITKLSLDFGPKKYVHNPISKRASKREWLLLIGPHDDILNNLYLYCDQFFIKSIGGDWEIISTLCFMW